VNARRCANLIIGRRRPAKEMALGRLRAASRTVRLAAETRQIWRESAASAHIRLGRDGLVAYRFGVVTFGWVSPDVCCLARRKRDQIASRLRSRRERRETMTALPLARRVERSIFARPRPGDRPARLAALFTPTRPEFCCQPPPTPPKPSRRASKRHHLSHIDPFPCLLSEPASGPGLAAQATVGVTGVIQR
jgi:hypothetical protein